MKWIVIWFNSIRFKLKSRWNEPASRYLFFLIAFVLSLAVIMYLVEKRVSGADIKTVSDTIWWFFVTISTVGYGDLVPKTGFGRFIGILSVFGGVILFSVFSGSITSFLVDFRLKERRGLGKVAFKDHIVILGWNQNLERVVSNLPTFLGSKDFNLALVNEGNEDEYDEFKTKYFDMNIRFVHGDFTKESVLKRANVEDAKAVIILADTYGGKKIDESDERTLLATLTIKAGNSHTEIYAEVIKEEKAKHIKRAGADVIILNGEFNPILLSSSVTSPALPTFIRELLNVDEKPKLRLENVPKSFVGKSFGDLFHYLRGKTSGLPVGLLTTERELTINDLLSDDSSIDSFIRAKFKEAQSGDFEDDESSYKVKINPKDDYLLNEDDTAAFVIY